MSQLQCKIYLFDFYFILSALIVLPYVTRTAMSPSYKLENGTVISLHSTCDRHRELTYFL